MWLKLSDNFASNPRILHAARSRAEVDRILGMLVALMLYAAAHRTDGFVPGLVVREHIRSRRLLQAFTDPDDGAAPLLHPRGTSCECMRGLDWPATAADYYVHAYLDHNPYAAEYDLAARQRAELRDPALREAVRARDLDRCRYCGRLTKGADRVSGRGRVLDHVDPDQACGAGNLVVACRECNSRKGKRTPEGAGMNLLPPPVLGGPAVDDPAELVPTYDGTRDDDPAPTHRDDTDAPGRDGTGRGHDPARPPPRGGYAGPNGVRHPAPPPPQRQSSVHPNPYHRQAITGPQPDNHAGLSDDDP